MRSRFIATVAVMALAAGLLGMIPAQASHDEDAHEGPLKLLAQKQANISKELQAQGSDLAFQGRTVFAGSFQGTSFFKIVGRRAGFIKQVGFHECPGGQGDVSVMGNLLFVSIDAPASNSGNNGVCNNTKTNRSDSSVGKEGVRIVDISNLAQPKQVGFVETDCGSHTQTLVPSGDKLYMYVESYPISGQGPSCNQVTHRKFSIVEINKQDPVKSDVVAAPQILPPDTVGCHDVTILPDGKRAIAACLGVWITMDISNPVEPKILSETRNSEIELDHSSAVTWDGKIALIGDEHAGAAGGGGCSNDSSSPVGALWFYDISGDNFSSPKLLGHHSLPRVPQADSADEAERFRCTTHNFNVIPFKDPKKYMTVVSYYSGGMAVLDFSDIENGNVKEVAYWVHTPSGQNPDMWASYWYNGRIYTNDYLSKFGVGVYKMRGTGAKRTHFFKDRMNPQVQVPSFR